jgi:hypothetical protein
MAGELSYSRIDSRGAFVETVRYGIIGTGMMEVLPLLRSHEPDRGVASGAPLRVGRGAPLRVGRADVNHLDESYDGEVLDTEWDP